VHVADDGVDDERIVLVFTAKPAQGYKIGISALLQVPTPKLGIPGVLDLRRGNVVAPRKLLAIGK